ncbi:MAG: hypothetical protein JNM72_10090 [Deltaproteobacteria bacterium]|nr:hypothetical protein [Deltaproteobacteria bacterium]
MTTPLSPGAPTLTLTLPAGRPRPAWLASPAPLEATVREGADPLAVIEAQAGVDDVIIVVCADPDRPPAALLAATAAQALPGVGERLRALLTTRIGPQAAFVLIGAGWVKGSLVLVLPDRPALVEDAFADLIQPRFAAAAALAAASSAAAPALIPASSPTLVPAPTLGGLAPEEDATQAFTVDARGIGAGEPPTQTDGPVEGAWHRAMGALGLQLGARAHLPPALDRLAPVRNLLEQAGELRRATDAEGEGWVLAGFPDLRSPHAKVLLLSEAEEPEGLVLRALHRHPRVVGVAGDRAGPGLPLRGDPAGALSEELLGQADPEGGSFFGREAAAVWLLRAGRVFRWDGRHSSPMGTPSQALASLCLEWSQR